MRTVPVLAVTGALVAALLSGCSTVTTETNCVVPEGSASDLVTASGAAGTSDAARFPTPLHAASTQRSVLSAGSGRVIGKGDVVGFRMTLYDGVKGSVLTRAGTTNQLAYGIATSGGIQVANGQSALTLRNVGSALQCTHLGSTLAVVLTSRDLGDSGVPADFSAVAVITPVRSLPYAANGAPQTPQPGFPGVVSAPDGRPGFIATDPNARAPKKVRTELTKKGSGPTIKANENVVVQYLGVSYPANEELSSSWSKGIPAVVSASSKQSSQDLPGAVTGQLAGKRVGSRLVVLVPASDGGQTTGGAAAYVVDILGTL